MKAVTEVGQSQDIVQVSLEGLEHLLWLKTGSNGSAGMHEELKSVLVSKRTFFKDRSMLTPACHQLAVP